MLPRPLDGRRRTGTSRAAGAILPVKRGQPVVMSLSTVEASVPDKIAVLFVHGIEAAGEELTNTAERRLAGAFTEASGTLADDVLVVQTAYWVPVLADAQDRLVARLGGGDRTRWFFERLGSLAGRVSTGSVLALLPLLVGGAVRWLPGIGDFHWPALRWLAVHYVGDAVAYQGRSSPVYGRVHGVLAQKLRVLAEVAGPDAPLVIVAHSLGAVVAGNYVYDLQAERVYSSAPELPAEVRDVIGDTPLERGETLARLFTLGSPLALYTLGWNPDELDRPLVVPDPAIAERLGHEPGWTNVYDPDDVIAAPLEGTSPAYAERVRDERVRVGPFPLGATPLAHPGYWNDRQVVRAIGRSVAEMRAALLDT